VRAIGAVRWDDSDIFPAQLSPKGALIFTAGKNHALRLTLDRAFLTPNVAQLFDAHPYGRGKYDLTAIETKLRSDPAVRPALAAVESGTLFSNSAEVPAYTLGNPHLVPQTVTSYGAGYKGQFGTRVFLTLDAYDARIENFTTVLLPAGATGGNPDWAWTAPPEVPAAFRAAVEAAALRELAALDPTRALADGLTRLADGTTAIVQSYGNAGTVDEWGVELGTNVSVTQALTMSASYTWYSFAIRQANARSPLAPNTPTHKGTVAVEYAGRQRLTFGVDVRIVAAYRWKAGGFDGDVPASQTVNLNARYRITPHLRVYANATNLLDQQRFQVFGGSVIGRRVLAGMTSTF
jgi:outer membrane receptor protein involved in Fe transport